MAQNDAQPNAAAAPSVLLTTTGRVRVIGINRPAHRNAVDRATASALADAMRAFDADAAVDVAVLYGVGDTFCASADLKALAAGAGANDVNDDGDGPMGPTRLRLGKPVIAAIAGFAVAGGLELALWADLRVVEKSAVFGVFCRRWGVPLIDGGTARLPALIGLSRALDLILTGRAVAAEEALAIGLANRVVDDGTALDAAIALATSIAGAPQHAMRGDRLAALEGVGQPIEVAMAGELRRGRTALALEAVAGAARFVTRAGAMPFMLLVAASMIGSGGCSDGVAAGQQTDKAQVDGIFVGGVVDAATDGEGGGAADNATDGSTTDGGSTDDGGTDDGGKDGGATDDGATDDGDGAAADVGAKLGAPYPVVLAHGFFGTDAFAGLAFATYFFGVKADLESHGVPVVAIPVVDPFNSSVYRGAQLLTQVEALLAETGYEKVVIIGHSQGGLDARYVASVRPDLVAAVVTFATPHKGSIVADVASGALAWPAAKAVVDALMNLAGVAVWKAVDGASSLSSAVAQLSTAAMIAFNADYPNRPGVAYYSLAGRSALSLATDACKADLLVDFVVAYDKVVDPLDPFFYATREVIDGGFLKAIPHDGLVRVDDARWGTFLGCVPADHLDEIGQIFGDYPGGFNTFDHKKLFRDLVAMLRAQGF